MAKSKARQAKSVAPPVPVDQKALHALAHAVRIRRVLDVRPDGGAKKAEYDQSLKVYRYQWAVLSPDQKKAIVAAAKAIPDLTAAAIAATVTALEG